MRHFFTKLALCLIALSSAVHANDDRSYGPPCLGDAVRFDPLLTLTMTGFYGGTGEEHRMLQQKNRLEEYGFYVGAKFVLSSIWEHSNQKLTPAAGNAYTFTHVTNGSADDKSTYQAQATAIWLTFTQTVGTWVTGSIELLTGEVTATATAPMKVDLKKGYIIFGNLDEMPVYAWIGKKDVNFGSHETRHYHSFNLTRAAFRGTSVSQTGIGYSCNGIHATATAIGGGPNGFNAYSVDRGLGANFAADASYSGDIDEDFTYRVGGSYLHGTGFMDANSDRNGAWAAYAQLSYNGFTLLGEYFRTTKKTPAPGGKHASAYSAEAHYTTSFDCTPIYLAAGYSHLTDGSGSARRAHQGTTSIIAEPWDYVLVGLEYCYNKNVAGVPVPFRGTPPISQGLIAGVSNQQNHSVMATVAMFW